VGLNPTFETLELVKLALKLMAVIMAVISVACCIHMDAKIAISRVSIIATAY